MQVKVLSSGSKGNCSLILCDNIKLLIDIGLSCLKVQKHLEDNLLSLVIYPDC